MAGSTWGEFFRGLSVRRQGFFRELGGLISIIVVVGFALASAVWGSWLGISIVGLLAFLLVVGWCLDVFTRPLKKMQPNDVVHTVREMVLISYVFVLIALSVAFLPPVVLGIDYYLKSKDSTDSATPSAFYRAMVDSPVGLVRGCVHTRKETEWELACPSPSPQAIATPGITAPINPALASSPHAVATPAQKLDDTYAGQWLFKIGGSALQDEENVPIAARSALFYPVMVFGGLAVPWYFIMLAIMGAAVSMARRVPEYQRDVNVPDPSDDAKTPDAALDPPNSPPIPKDDGKSSAPDVKSNLISAVQVRELLVFQIMQVLSAPLIAITAYNAMMPTSRSSSVALAFASGFASESVLLVISSIAEKIKPDIMAPEKK
jgi:hypothetical protein